MYSEESVKRIKEKYETYETFQSLLEDEYLVESIDLSFFSGIVINTSLYDFYQKGWYIEGDEKLQYVTIESGMYVLYTVYESPARLHVATITKESFENISIEYMEMKKWLDKQNPPEPEEEEEIIIKPTPQRIIVTETNKDDYGWEKWEFYNDP